MTAVNPFMAHDDGELGEARELDAVSDKLAQIGRRTPVSSGRDVVLRGERDRQRATEDRACAAAERALAAENRAQAAADRLRSADDRQAAVAEQQQLAHAGELPGGWSREPGLVALRRESTVHVAPPRQ